MQKHFYIGLGILLVFLVLGFLVAFCMSRVCDPISTQLENAAREALSGNLEQGIFLAADGKFTAAYSVCVLTYNISRVCA